MRKKVVTHKSNEIYTFESCEDQTVAGIWKQSQGISLTAPFTKISLSKVVLFSDAKAKADYFRQQSDFVNRFGKLDKLAEFSTSIQVHGYRPKLLAIRPTQGLARPTHQFRVYHFWLYTIFGLTVPFRIIFARHCDELRVAVVKETSAECKTEGLMSSWVSKSWFGSSISQTLEEHGENFRNRMEEMSLYERSTAVKEENSLPLKDENGLQSTEQSREPTDNNSTSISIIDVDDAVSVNTTLVSGDNSTDGSITSSKKS
eukprot:CAMPEP_0198262214 /NCGR_PEP_ID=MMETSP1447-20131203/10769_1 /TAXON_ID=420782 /ORGANISM="Chaetoceros dichaeta, Strain CCMP1751" /LENGTH=258 /DNA_ID=CAMNT_0043950383 /DNA_START=774 /DNA_END=1550 /DNA_ORIENTATION=-